MGRSWHTIRTETVTKNGNIKFPDEFVHKVSFKGIDGKRVHWSYDMKADVMVISNQKLTNEDRYEWIADTAVLSGGQISPPSGLVEKITRPIYYGLIVAYLAHEEMLSNDPKSLYLLTDSQVKSNSQIRSFLNETSPIDGSKDIDLKTMLLETPSFLPPVE